MEQLPQQAVYGVNPRDEVRPHIPRQIHSALDVGCGAGGFGTSLREAMGKSARIMGIEPVVEQAALARKDHGFDEVLDGYFPDALADRDEKFDLVVFNDVLEHTLDPWTILDGLHSHLTPGGHVLATIPSIQFAPVLWEVARGRWDYTDDGTLDRTHVRFFTRSTMIEMFEAAGYRIDSCTGVNSVAKRWATDPNPFRRRFKTALSKRLGDAQYVQFVIVATSLRA